MPAAGDGPTGQPLVGPDAGDGPTAVLEPGARRWATAGQVRRAHAAATSGRRRFVTACLTAGAVSEIVFAWLATSGNWDLFQQRQLSNLYDVQARALFHGHWWMPATALSIEGIRTGSREYMYYGPFPALIRMPVLLFTSRLDGRLTTVSMMLGLAVALTATARLSWKARQLARPGAPASRGEVVATAGFLMVVGVGSILLWLASWTTVYHEAELWGAALTLLALDAAIGFVLRPSGRRVAWSGIVTCAALLTRGSVAAGAVTVLAVLAAAHAVAFAAGRLESRRPSRWGRSVARLARRPAFGLADPAGGRSGATYTLDLGAAAVVPVIAYAWINWTKFHTWFGLPLDRQVYTALSSHRQEVLAANHGSLFGLKFVPTALLQYLRPDGVRFQGLFPFLRFPPKAVVIGHVIYDSRDYASSAPSTMPLLVLLGLVGLVAVFSRWPAGGRLAPFRLAVVGATVGAGGALEIAYVANRYLSDFLPFIVLVAVIGFQALAAALPGAKVGLRTLVVTVAVLASIFSVWATVGLGLLYQRVLEPGITITTRAAFVSTQERIDGDLNGSHPSELSTGSHLPITAGGLPGSLFLVGRCSGLYQSVGGNWYPAEQGAAAGHRRFRLTFPVETRPVRQPLVTVVGSGSNDVLAVHYLGGDRLDFSYLAPTQGATWLDGNVLTIVPGRSYVVDVTLDPSIQEASVVLDGTEVYDLRFYLVPGRFVIGRAVPGPDGSVTAPAFTGKIAALPVTTPICDGLLHRVTG